MSQTISTMVSAMMAEQYRLRPDKMQYFRSRETLRHFAPRKQLMHGEKFHIKVRTEPGAGARRVNAVTSETTEWPEASSIGHVDVYREWSNLIEFRNSVEYTGLAAAKTRSLEDAVFNAATELVNKMDDELATLVNMAVHQNADCVLALVKQKYDPDGTTYTASIAKADAGGVYISIDNGSISQFVPGMGIQIRAASDNTTTRINATVKDVYYQSTGPGGTASIGPGIRLLGLSTSTDANWDAVTDNDEICLSGETDTNFEGFGTFFSNTAAFMGITRTALGSAWAIPMMLDANPGSTPEVLDLDTHFGTMALDFAAAVKTGRNARKADGIEITGAMIALGDRHAVSEMSRQMGDRVKFTTELTPAVRKELFGVSGFDGGYWHDPHIGPIALVSDPVATPNKIRFLEPSSWFWLTGHEGGVESPEWLDADGTKIRYKPGANGRPTNVLAGGALLRLALCNDQPRANYEISNVTSSLA